jgi:hypothetical protein
MVRVGRFQVMAMLQAARALALGLRLDEAKSWGLNRAIFYAAAKRGFRHPQHDATATPARVRRSAAPATEARYELGGEAAYLAHDGAHPLRFQIGGEEQTPATFDREVVERVPDWERAWAEAQAVIAAAPREDLESQHRFFDNVYRPRRDELARRWSA